jgi:hypothetical protein
LQGNYDLGVIGYNLATYANEAFTPSISLQYRYPDYAYVSYTSGEDAGTDYYMSRFWQRIVSHYGIALMDMPLCDCSDVKDNFNYWQIDLGVAGPEGAHTYSQSSLENPLGNLRRGAVDAWNAIRRKIEL